MNASKLHELLEEVSRNGVPDVSRPALDKARDMVLRQCLVDAKRAYDARAHLTDMRVAERETA